MLSVSFQGGHLLGGVEPQALYLGSDWNQPTYKPVANTLDTFVNTLVNSTYMDMLTGAVTTSAVAPLPRARLTR